MKTCFKCHRSLPIGDFYAHPAMGDGHLGKCKACTKKDTAERAARKSLDIEWLANEVLRQREKAARLGRKRPEQSAARNAVRALGKTKSEHWHHWSYRPEHRLDVIRLSASDHRRVHERIKYDEAAMMFRVTDTNELLDTRDRHEQFLNTVIHLTKAA